MTDTLRYLFSIHSSASHSRPLPTPFMADRDADWLSVDDARMCIMGTVRPLPSEVLPLDRTLGRVLAEPIVSSVDLPPWDNSSMDGFAVRAADIGGASPEAPVELQLLEDIAAGRFPTRTVRSGTASRVMTGAPIPEGADSVVRVEHTDGGSGGGRVRVLNDLDAGGNVRRRGEDLRAGDVVLPAGCVMRPAAVGVAAGVGRSQLSVYRRPLVAIASSGDELVPVDRFGEVAAGRRIVSTNDYSLSAQTRDAGMEVRSLGIAPDDPDELYELLLGARGCDALVTTAGISVGAHDHTRAVLERLGVSVEFWRVRMRPGSPLAFGRIEALGGIPWFGLPGNPVSAMVTFELFVRPALLRMAGHEAPFRPVVEVEVGSPLALTPQLTHFSRVRLTPKSGGGWLAHPTGPQGSGILTSIVAADALLVVPEGVGSIEPGNVASAILLNGSPLEREPGYSSSSSSSNQSRSVT